MDDEQLEFLTFWFSGLIDGLERVDERARAQILRSCGLACAQSYTAAAFQSAWQQGGGCLDGFLEQLGKKFPGAVYEKIDEQLISVRLAECACDLVKLGWVKKPLLCQCSLNNLQQNFEASMGRPVQVVLKSSILGGSEQCWFEVRLLETSGNLAGVQSI